ncbi:MAG: sulfate/thiosulfate transport system permease protein [Frankiaceae bacterium]|nr:sulfate/thiosulfate transport system permease protein [Frankiaceae bacterium]
MSPPASNDLSAGGGGTLAVPPLTGGPRIGGGRTARRGLSGRFVVGPTLTGGFVVLFLSVVVLIPLAVLVYKSTGSGWAGFWHQVHSPFAWSALKLTVVMSLLVALINLVMGTAIAWLLVRDRMPGRQFLDTIIDLPFALPTIVAGVTLILLFGPTSPIGINLAYARSGVLLALLFVSLPFVVRTVQPVLLELDRDMEEAAASLGASQFTIFRRIILPTIAPAMAAGTTLAFARALSEFGSTVLISGNLPGKTQVAAVFIYGKIQEDSVTGAAAVSTVLLAVSLVVLVLLNVIQLWVARRD